MRAMSSVTSLDLVKTGYTPRGTMNTPTYHVPHMHEYKIH